MKIYSLPVKLVVCGALVCCTLVLSQIISLGQGRSLTTQQVDQIVKPSLSQCSGPGIVTNTANGQTKQVKNARLDPYTIIPTANAVEFSLDRVAKTMHGMWRGQVIGSPLDNKYEKSKEGNVDYFWIFDMARGEALIIALRNGNNSVAGMSLPTTDPPKLSYLICAHEGYIPTVEKGSEIHEFTKVSNSIDNAADVLSKATGLKFITPNPTLSDLWQEVVASGYFQSLPAVAFAGGFFNPIRLELVPSSVGPSQVSMSWDSEYYGGGTTWIKFTPGVPMRGVEYSTFVGTTATSGDYLVASPGNGKLAKVEALVGGDYDLAFDSVTFGPMCDGECDGICPECGPIEPTETIAPAAATSPAKGQKSRTKNQKDNHGRRRPRNHR